MDFIHLELDLGEMKGDHDECRVPFEIYPLFPIVIIRTFIITRRECRLMDTKCGSDTPDAAKRRGRLERHRKREREREGFERSRAFIRRNARFDPRRDETLAESITMKGESQ